MSSTQPASPPSMFTPWVMVLIAGSCIVTVTLGIRQVFGLFMVPISNELGTGLQTFSLAIAVQNLLWGASSPFFGALADRIGAWKVAALGALIYSAGLLFTALMVTETGIFLGQMLIGIGMGSAGISIALGAVARAVPPGKRSLAFGMVTSFGSFGQFALLPITQLLIGGYGWQMALILLSVLTGAMMAVAQLVAGAGRAVQHSGGFHLRMAGWQIVKTQNTGKRLSASRSGNCRLCDHAAKRDKRAHVRGSDGPSVARDNSAYQRVDCGVLWPETSEHALWHRVPVAPAGLVCRRLAWRLSI